MHCGYSRAPEKRAGVRAFGVATHPGAPHPTPLPEGEGTERLAFSNTLCKLHLALMLSREEGAKISQRLTQATAMTREEFSAILAAHYQTHQAMEPQDVYKLIYQAVFGPEHSVDNLHAAAERLYLEVLHLPGQPVTVPLIEFLSPLLCRVSLQPFVQQGGDVRGLWHIFRRTLREYQPGTLVDLARYWKFFVVTPWAQRYETAWLEQFWQRMATVNFAPVHHSQAYAEANVPRYRVVLQALVEESRLS